MGAMFKDLDGPWQKLVVELGGNWRLLVETAESTMDKVLETLGT